VAEAAGFEILHFESDRPVSVSFYVARLRQKPHPPFWMAAGTPSSIRRVAERAACGRAYNPMGIALARDMHVANNQAAKDAALERNRQFHERILAVARWPDRARN
jgi:hypothetical protein